MLYLAYGSNLCIGRMLERCPSAIPVARVLLNDYRLVFMENNTKRIVANIVEEKGKSVYAVIYDIDDKEVPNLDRAEGFPYVYKKKYFNMSVNGIDSTATAYVMDLTFMNIKTLAMVDRAYGKPDREYLRYIEDGYEDFVFPERYLIEALDYSKKKKGIKANKKSNNNKIKK